MTVIYERFAGGTILVEPDVFITTPVVRLELPGLGIDLRPHEALELAKALADAAGDAQPARRLRRHPDVDTALSALDG